MLQYFRLRAICVFFFTAVAVAGYLSTKLTFFSPVYRDRLHFSDIIIIIILLLRSYDSKECRKK